MEFELNELEREVSDLAGSIMRDHCSPERLLELEESGMRLDRQLWAALREAGLTAVGVLEEHGGPGLGFAEACVVLQEAGRTTAAVPLLGHLVGLYALQRAAALSELRQFAESEGWLASIAQTGGSNTLRFDAGAVRGDVAAVPYASGASAYVLPARHEGGWVLCLVGGSQPGISVEELTATDKSPVGRLVCRDAEAIALGGSDLVGWVQQRLLASVAAVQAGVVDAAIALTTAYVSEREAFGVKIGTFQAVSQRMADAYIDSMALQLLVRNAAAVLAKQDDGLVDALSAKITAGDVGHRILHTCQQVHGGIGHDRSYPLWRYTVAAKQNELAGMCSAEAAAGLGRLLAADPARFAL